MSPEEVKTHASAWLMLSDEQLKSLVSLVLPGCRYQMTQTLEQCRLQALDSAINPCAFQEGRVFGAGGDLHWRRQSRLIKKDDGALETHHGWQVVFIGPSDALAAVVVPDESQALESPREEKVLLRGERRGGQQWWLEARTPTLFDYPWQADDPHPPLQLALEIHEYYQDDRAAFVQWLGLVSW